MEKIEIFISKMKLCKEQHNPAIIANELIFEGIEFRKIGELEKAREYYAVSYGLNIYLERYKQMLLCTFLLKDSGLKKEEVRERQKRGCEIVACALREVNYV